MRFAYFYYYLLGELMDDVIVGILGYNVMLK